MGNKVVTTRPTQKGNTQKIEEEGEKERKSEKYKERKREKDSKNHDRVPETIKSTTKKNGWP